MRVKIILCIMLFLGTITYAQKKAISGNVTDATGPLTGVTVIIKGTTIGAETDFDGNYTIQASTGQTLVFSYLGYKTEERVIGNQTRIDVKMVEEQTLLQEIVVAFRKQKKEYEIGARVLWETGDQTCALPIY